MRAVDLPPLRAGGRTTLRRTLLDDVLCDRDTDAGRRRQAAIVQEIASAPELWRLPLSAGVWTEMRVRHDGSRWCVDLSREE